jgi:hypothetical protein
MEIDYKGIVFEVEYELTSAPMYEDEENYNIDITGISISDQDVSALITDEVLSIIKELVNEKL